MRTRLTVLRGQNEASRFSRLRTDDSRTAIPPSSAESLARTLKKSIDGEVRFDKGTRALYATDGSNYRQVPIGVVVPRHVQDVETTIRIAREYDAPLLARGGGTSLAGQCCNVAVVMDFSKYMHRVLRIDAQNRLGHVQAGCVLDHFRETAKKEAGLFFGPDPATHSRCTIGGMLGNNSCGSHSLLSKNNGLGVRMSDNTHALDVVLYDGTRLHVGPTSPAELETLIRGGGRRGEIYAQLKSLVDRYGNVIREKFPKLERRVSGYNLNDLLPENGFNVARALVGSESTLVTIVQAALHLVPAPKERSVVMLGFKDIYLAAECALEVLKFNPTACEGIDELLFDYVKQKGDESASLAILPKGPAFLLVEFGGDSKNDTDDQSRKMMDHVKNLGERAPVDMKLYDDPKMEKMIWDVREGGLGSTAWIPDEPDTWPGWEDSAVPVEAVPQYLRELRALFKKFDYNPSVYGHMGQGCIHCRVQFDLYTAHGLEQYKKFMNEAVELVMKFGGVASGEHGDGQARGQFLPKMFGSELFEAFVEFKRIWDPANRMNTGKVVNLDGAAYGITENLRVGPDYNPPQPQTHFAYAGDRHSFARAALRCVGVGACRREGGGTMCPSYMVTREEKDSTRGRARMLFEMMNGEVIEDGWKSDEVKEALDLCLSCKGCKGDCPVNVDMATYKAEFLSHYYEGRLRPRHAYAFGWIHIWSTLVSFAPSVANLFTQVPGLSAIAKFAAGVHPKRKIPAFAPQSFKHWFRSHTTKNPSGPPVVLFADTFNNHFHPDVAIAATEVLEDAGFQVRVPMADMCCGRPLYDYGFLGMAERWWIDLLDKLRPYYRQGIPMVVLEPSCWAAFKDELCNLLHNNEDGKRLSELTFTLSDFLRSHAPNYTPPMLKRKAIVHGHCHQKAIDTLNDKEYGKLFAEKEIFKKMGIEDKHPDAGCCGMAGAFGYEQENDHYEVSVAAGERVLLPEVRSAADDELIIADGFSCQEQIEQQTDRAALHMAQVLQLAIHGGDKAADVRPEAAMVAARKRSQRIGMTRAALTIGVGVAAAFFCCENGEKPPSCRAINGVQEMNNIGSKTVVVITGASGGVGRATARLFATRGAKIVLLARGKDGLEGAKHDVESRGGSALALPTDVSQFDQVQAAADRAEREFGPIDLWINNAMVSMYSPFMKMSPDEFRHIVEVTFLGNVYGTHCALQQMMKRDKGVVIQVGSALAFRSIPLQSAYCASKHAIQGFTESVRSELIHQKSNVRVSVVNMPALNTTQFTWTKNKMPHKARPTGTIFQPEVAADAILFAAEHDRREVMVGYTTIEATLGEKIIPGMLDHYLAKAAWEGSMLPAPADPDQPDNFWNPVPGDHGSHGKFDKLARDFSVQLWATKHRKALIGGLALAGLGAAAAIFQTKTSSRHNGAQ